MPDFITSIWNTVFFQPMLNGLILLYGLFFHNFGLTIVIFTILVRIVILPLTIRQLNAAKSMAKLQPELAKLQKKFANDRQAMSQAQMELYKKYGVNPLGCAVPTLIQFPVWIGLYQSILAALAATPENLMSLSRHLYPSIQLVHQLVPLDSRFLWLDLASPDPLYILPVFVAASGWLQQKMSTMPTDDPRQQQMNQSMQWMMPIMFGFFTISFASGLAIYWFISNVISIIVQYFVSGWGSLTWFNKTLPSPASGPDDDDSSPNPALLPDTGSGGGGSTSNRSPRRGNRRRR